MKITTVIPTSSVERPTPVGMAERTILSLSQVTILGCVLGTMGLAAWLIFGGLPNVRGVENNVIFGIQQILLGRSLYTDPAQFPFQIVQYSPFYYYLCAAIAKVCGVGPTDVYGLHVVARGLSSVLEVARLGIAYGLLRRFLHVGRGMALLAVTIIFIGTAPWNFLARPDALVAICLLGGIACVLQMFARAQTNPRASVGYLAGAVILGCAATMAKQNGFIFLAILFSFLFFTKDWKRLFLGTGLAILAGALSLALAFQAGPALKSHLIDGVRNGSNLVDAFTRAYHPFWSTMSALFGFSVLVILKWLRPTAGKERQFLAYTMTILFLSASALSLKVGSISQYYYDFMAVALVAAFGLWPALADKTHINSLGKVEMRIFAMTTIACLLTMLLGNHLYVSVYRPLNPVVGRGTLSDRKEVASLLITELSQHPDKYYFSLDGMVDILLPQRCLMPQKDVIEISHERGLVNYSEFARLVKTGRVRYLVAPAQEIPKSFAGVSFDRYVKLQDCGKFSLYVWQGE